MFFVYSRSPVVRRARLVVLTSFLLLLADALPASIAAPLTQVASDKTPPNSHSPVQYPQRRHKRSFLFNDDGVELTQPPPAKFTIEGYLGCKYDSDVCNVDEACFDDGLFGQCWTGIGSPAQAFAVQSDHNDHLSDSKLSALRHTFDFLHRYELSWKDYVSQCILTQILADRHSRIDQRRLADFYRECLNENEQLNELILADENDHEENELSPRYINEQQYASRNGGVGAQYRDPYLPSPSELLLDVDRFYVPLPSAISQEEAAALGLAPSRQRLFESQSPVFDQFLQALNRHQDGNQYEMNPALADDDDDDDDDEDDNNEHFLEESIQDESQMETPTKLTVPVLEHHAGLLETLQINNNKQQYPFMSQEAMIRKNLTPFTTSKNSNKSLATLVNNSDSRYFTVSTASGYIAINREFRDPAEGARLLAIIAQANNWPYWIFTEPITDHKILTFHVVDNPYKINATNVANAAFNIQKSIESQLGFRLTDSGIGDRGRLLPVERRNGSRLALITLVTCSIVLFTMGAFALLFFLKRNDRIRNKLAEITHIKGFSTNDYQDLCRQRMSTQPTGSNKSPEIHNVQQQSSSPSSVPPPYTPPGSANAGKNQTSEGSSNRSSTSSWSEDPLPQVNMDIMTGHLILSYMEDHLRNRHRLDAEWQALCMDEANPEERPSCAIALSSFNASKNRYTDCVPFDHARIVLSRTSEGDDDYINASPITDSDPKCKYIATQGPMPATAGAFWKMVWEQGSCVIVALTRPIEDGVTMCHHYWPVEGSERFNDYEVNLVSEHIWSDDYLVRSFFLKNMQTMETRTVTQFHFLTWPELGVPPSAKTLLDFRRKVNKCFRGKSSPIVVHCNDGVGRTGTYVLLDMVIHRICKGAREIDIAAALEHIRDQRPKMVKSKIQFEFTFAAVAEEVSQILKAIPQ